jgi:catechol 2,3-dioxygenase-like lactoylglutathione lyase family enzyme
MDRGFSHIALTVRDVFRSIDFYRDFADFEVVHLRGQRGRRVAWLSDLRRPFALVLAESESDEVRLAGVAHLGVACESRTELDARCAIARIRGHLTREPEDGGKPVGYWALLEDPDGHQLELSFGQDVGAQVRRALRTRRPPTGTRFVGPAPV